MLLVLEVWELWNCSIAFVSTTVGTGMNTVLSLVENDITMRTLN